MGCDIHLFAEERNTTGCWEHIIGDFYKDRNYRLFSVLADVRNDHGFAGCDTGNRMEPIAMPKGLPSDVSLGVKAVSDDWGCDGHSHSWFTVKELMDYDWTQIATLRGLVHALEFYRWERWPRRMGRSPEAWSGMVSGRGVVHISEEEMRSLIQQWTKGAGSTWKDEEEAINSHCRRLGEAGYKPSYYAKCEWQRPYYGLCREFLGETLPQLWRLGPPEDVRIVFWFDN